MSKTLQRCALLFIVLLMAFGCGGKGEGVSAYTGLGLSRDRVLVVRDESQSVDVQVQLAHGEQSGTVVNLSVTGLRDGVTATMTPATMTLTDTNIHTARLTVTASRTVDIGHLSVVVHRVSGGSDHTQTIDLQVADFAVYVDVDSTSVTVHPNGTEDVDVVLTRRGNSNGTVEMTLAGDVPDGVSWSLSPARVQIDADHTREHVRLRFEGSADQTTNGKETCRARALKGINHNDSDGIDVSFQTD